MKFKVGDKVRVIRKVKKENGWNNCWIDGSMDQSIGHDFYVKEIDPSHGIRLSNNDGYVSYAFPPSSLILLPECDTKKPTPFEAPNYSEKPSYVVENVKYQYLTADKWEICENPKLKDLCVSISTEIDYVENQVFWSVSYKHPKDQFNKTAARKSLFFKNEYSLSVGKEFTHTEIVFKILSYILYESESVKTLLTAEYKEFVWVLISRYMYLNNEKRA